MPAPIPNAKPLRPVDFAQANRVSPSAGFTGTAGSGFGGAHPAAPTDPTRTTAKPACRLLVPDRMAFATRHLVGVFAGANDGGDLLDTMGLSSVTFHFEGGEKTVTRPSWQDVRDANGVLHQYWGWWCWLEHSGTDGAAQLYVTATPRDGTMQARVIGPYVFLPVADLPVTGLHDYQLTVTPSAAEVVGSQYQSLPNALHYLRSVSAQRPRVLITEDNGAHTIEYAFVHTASAGRVLVEASVPVTFALTSGAKGQQRCRFHQLHFRGSNITFDMRYISGLRMDEGVGTGSSGPVLDGVTFVNSGGRNEYWDKGPRPGGFMVNAGAWFLECACSDTSNTFLSSAANLVRGCTASNLIGDAATAALCVVASTFDDMDATAVKADVNAMTVHYSGGGASATLALSGSNDAATRTFTAKVAGSSVGTFTVVNNNPAGNYDVADVVAWLNGLSGFTAVLLDDTRRATSLGLQGGAGTAFGDTDVKTATLTLMTQFDLHPDWYQSQTGGAENLVIADNVAMDLAGQEVFLTTPMKDVLVLGNVFHRKPGNTAYYTQLSNAHSHVVIAHNSWTDQTVRHTSVGAAFSADGYCLMANNAFADFDIFSTDPDLVATGNHFQAGATARGSNASTGGTKATLFADADAGDFAPSGALLSNPKPAVLKYDPRHRARGTTGTAGAWA